MASANTSKKNDEKLQRKCESPIPMGYLIIEIKKYIFATKMFFYALIIEKKYYVIFLWFLYIDNLHIMIQMHMDKPACMHY